MIVLVTGGAGFIGSNIVRQLVNEGKSVIVVDDLDDNKFKNLLGVEIYDFIHRDDFYPFLGAHLSSDEKPVCDAVLHNGAISSTTASNSREVITANFDQSRLLLAYCNKHKLPFIYASSAAVYGASDLCVEDARYEKPLNLYGFSKLLFDNFVRRLWDNNELSAQVVGLRYFNVYGPGEDHKQGQSSPMLRFMNEGSKSGILNVYSGPDGLGNQAEFYRRDFIHVADVVKVCLWFLDQPNISGIFNVGTSKSTTFEEVAQIVLGLIVADQSEFLDSHKIEHISMPKKIQGGSQPFTKANIEALREAGYSNPFIDIRTGIENYYKWWKNESY